MEEKQELSTKRKKSQVHTKIKALDSSSSLNSYYKIIELVQEKDKKSSRIRLALCLLYVTGFRISTLLLLRKFDIKNLLEHHRIKDPIKIKTLGSTFESHYVNIGTLGLSLLKDRWSDFEALMKGKNENDFLFTAYNKKQEVIKKDKALTRVTLNIDVNNTLKRASEEFNRKIRSHSFRVSYIRDMLSIYTPIESAQTIVGHKGIKTTAYYHQKKISNAEAKLIVMKVEKARELSMDIAKQKIAWKFHSFFH